MWKVFTRPTCASDFFWRIYCKIKAHFVQTYFWIIPVALRVNNADNRVRNKRFNTSCSCMFMMILYAVHFVVVWIFADAFTASDINYQFKLHNMRKCCCVWCLFYTVDIATFICCCRYLIFSGCMFHMFDIRIDYVKIANIIKEATRAELLSRSSTRIASFLNSSNLAINL
jgi:hypothetical protein